ITNNPYFIKDMGNGKVYANAQKGFVSSLDSGQTWNSINYKIDFEYLVLNQNIHIGINWNTTEVSTDGGLTWTTYYEKGIAKIKYIYAKTEDEYYMFGDYAREFSRIFRTTDRGNTWTFTDVASIWGTQQLLRT